MKKLRSDYIRAHFNEICDRVYDGETFLIERPMLENVVMISEKAYNNLVENLHVMGNKANYDWLIESKKKLEAGNINIHSKRK